MTKKQKLPKKIKIYALVSTAVFVVCIIGIFFVTSNYDVLQNNYNALRSTETEIENRLEAQNSVFYAHMLKEGILKITDSEGNEVGRNIVYPVAEKLYKYKIFVNNEQVTDSYDIVIKNSRCIVRIEEYFDSAALSKLPLSILHEFSYFRTKGMGGERVTIDDIISYTKFYEASAAIEDSDIKTVIRIEYNNLTAGNEIEVNFTGIYQKMGMPVPWLFVRYV